MVFKPRSLLVVLLVAVYGGLLIYLEGLRFPPTWDEPRFWETSLQFSHGLIPNFDQLRTYSELNTPLPFVVFGILEYLFHGGIFAGRLLNFGLSFAIVWLIGTSSSAQKYSSLLAVIGLFAFPYYWLLSGYLYTDIFAAFFVFLGCWCYIRRQNSWAGLLFILAIASRQFTLAFPLAITLHELLTTFRQEGFKLKLRWVAPLLATATIGGWILLFQGLAPPTALTSEAIAVPEVQQQLWIVDLSASLYFLACLGVYFVVPEWILFCRQWQPRQLLRNKHYALAFILLLLMIIFPPFEAHGVLFKAMNLIPVALVQLAVLYGLALLTVVRFSGLHLGFWLVLINAGLMIKAYPWDKYLLPLLVVLWYLRSVRPSAIGVLDPLFNSSAAPPEQHNPADQLLQG
jgi:hypothetical protein